MKDLLQRFAQLSERERLLVLVSTVLVIVFMFYYLLWSPLTGALEKERRGVAAKQTDLAWITKNANKAIQLRTGSANKSFTGSLPQAVNQTAGRVNIAISRMQPQGEELRVWVDQAPFNDVLSWLQSLETRGVVILSVDLSEANAPGMVKVRSLQLGKSQ